MYNLYALSCAIILAYLAGPLLIPVLHRLKFGQSIRQEGPESHYAKKGTPTMGGIMIIGAVLIALGVFSSGTREVWLAAGAIVGYGVLGFCDDFIKVVLKRSMGLKAKEKLFGEIFLALILAYFVHMVGRGTEVWIPGTAWYIDLGIMYYPFFFIVMVGFTNAVNLTDGLDGLAAGITAIAAGTYVIVAMYYHKAEWALYAAAVAGSCIGFLGHNRNPAKIFMGDTGSLALGGALAILSVMTKTELLLVLIGGVFVAETLSVTIQVTYFKITGGKRIFRMSPLHHHFELGGWSEVKVVRIFWLTGVILAVIATILLFISQTGGI